jgi:hypothetical protein
MSNELIRELVTELSIASDFLPMNGPLYSGAQDLIAKARAYLVTGGWTRVEDGLPVVPEGSEYVEIFFFCAAPGGRVGRRLWLDIDATVAHGITHWRYAEPTPEPPKG